MRGEIIHAFYNYNPILINNSNDEGSLSFVWLYNYGLLNLTLYMKFCTFY